MTRAAGEQPDALDLTLADLDVDGALRETAAAAFPLTRGDLFRRSATAAAAGAAGLEASSTLTT